MNITKSLSKLTTLATTGAIVAGATVFPQAVEAKTKKNERPNILVIWGDDIGQSNISAYSRGMMGYHTPNIDRIANEGMLFTDYYGEQSCTAGRSTFITGQEAFRTGLSKVGMPGAEVGLVAGIPTLADILKNAGYATGQFGKNHLGDKDEYLPTNHGFDEFYGNLYHLNAEEEPELPDYPKDPAFREKFGPRGVIHSYADGKIEDTGPLTKKRMETIDYETVAAAKKFMKASVKKDKPFFVWWNATRMHFRTHVKDSVAGTTGQGFYADGMVEHDKHVGELVDYLDDLKIADNTIVIYSTDNGPHKNTWPDAGANPFRGEKNSNWEGGWRVPGMVRWPGTIKPGSVSNEIMHNMDWFPTLIAAAGLEDVPQKLLTGYKANGKTFKAHIDAYNFLPYFQGKVKKGPREEIYYFTDDGDLSAIRFNDWKLIFMEQKTRGTLAVWAEPFTPLRVPLMFNLRQDPYETASYTSNTYYDWLINHAFLMYDAQNRVAKHMQTYIAYPPAQRAASFSVDQITDMINKQIEATQSKNG